MVRVIHLLSRTPDFQAERESAALAQYCGPEFKIKQRSIGRGGHYRNGLFAALAVRQQFASNFDVVHTWDSRALDAVALGGGVNLVFSSPGFLGHARLESMRVLALKRNAHLVCASALEHDAYLNADFPEAQCHLISPAVDIEKVRPRRDPVLRSALGFSEQDVIFLAPGESTRSAGHRDALWAVSILHVLHPNWKILLWGRGDEVNACDRLAAKLYQPNLLTIAERKLGRRVEFAEILPAVNAVISAPHEQTPILSLAMCMAAGLPIISTASPRTQELLRDGQNAALVSPHSARRVAQRAMEVMNNLELRSTIGSTAHGEALLRFPLNKSIAKYLALYRKISEGIRCKPSPDSMILRTSDD